MPWQYQDLAAAADYLMRLHGDRVRQVIVDEIVRSIRTHDMNAAKRWDEIGEEVDRRLAT